MHYVLAISTPPESQASHLALLFAKQLIDANHHIQQVFFYQAGTQHANRFMSLPSDELNLRTAWFKFSQEKNIPLHLCVTAAARRGVVDAHYSPCDTVSVQEGYTLAGLGEFTQAVLTCDRLIQF